MRNYASQRTQSQDLNNFSMFNTYSIVSYAINVYLIRSFHIETYLILHIRVHLTNLALRKKKAKAGPWSHTPTRNLTTTSTTIVNFSHTHTHTHAHAHALTSRTRIFFYKLHAAEFLVLSNTTPQPQILS